MSQIYNATSDVDRINVVCEQLAGFIMREILDPRGEFYHDGHIDRVSASTSWEARYFHYKHDLYICKYIIIAK